ncbi:hypothetical protein BsWGS_17497 [Bradybaena similaris]
MTTTSTFQGLNTDNKPSSRVLNPPGGSSSNIFGVSDAQAPARSQDRNNSDSAGHSSSPTVGPGQQQTAAAAQKSRPSRNGEDSFHSVFGNYRTCHEASGKASDSFSSPINGGRSATVEQPQINHAFNPITGEPYEQPKPKPQPHQPASNASVASSKTETGSSSTAVGSITPGSGASITPGTGTSVTPGTGTSVTPGTAESLSSETISSKEQQTAAVEDRSEPISQDQSQPAEPGKVEPTAQPGKSQAATAAQRNQQSGIFGPPEAAQEHRSTRVSQPPGGRSTKLW